MRSLAPILSVLAACGGPPEPPAKPAAPATTLADLSWLDGMWRGQGLDERWLHVAGAVYGVALTDGGFEIDLIDDNDAAGKTVPITLTTYTPDGDPASFVLVAASAGHVELASGARSVRFDRTEQGLHRQVLDGPKPSDLVLTGEVLAAAPELEAADRDFAIATATDGAAAWGRTFRADGWVWHGKRITGPDAVRDSMVKVLTEGVLSWRPTTSGKRGDWGFTIGTYEYGPKRGPLQEHGSYCTIWGQSADGWRIVFDIGRPAGDD